MVANTMHCDDFANQRSLTGMQAVILAAGVGSRLGCNGRPKCLVDVGGQSLIGHHLEVLEGLGVENILIVAGHGADQVMAEVRHNGVIQFNDRYSTTNSLYSLWLTRKWVSGSLMLINGDVLADPQIYRQLLEAEGNVLAYDSRSGTEDEHMKVRFTASRLREISKEMEEERADGEHLGMLKFDAGGARELMREADRLVAEGRVNEWAPAAVQGLAKRTPIEGIDVTELPWTEIDFPEDLEHARERVWPAIDRRSASGVGASSCRIPPHACSARLTN